MRHRIATEFKPSGLWNTQIDCLAGVAQSMCSGPGVIEVAGITGLAFRTSLCANASPASSFASWDHGFYLRHWLGALGIDADAYHLRNTEGGTREWIDRRLADTVQAVARGVPVICFDSFGFCLITGFDEAERYFELTGVPASCIHPVWQNHPESASLLARSARAGEQESLHSRVEWNQMEESLTGLYSFAIPRGVIPFDAVEASISGLRRCCREFGGEVGYQVSFDELQLSNDPLFGHPALVRLHHELEQQPANDFGIALAVNTVSEARSLGLQFLKNTSTLLPQFNSRLDQAAEFTSRIVTKWNRLAIVWCLPQERRTGIPLNRLQETREILYEILQTEKTIHKLLRSVVNEACSDEKPA